MNTDRPPQELLENAARLIERARQMLNVKSTECTCGHVHYEDRTEGAIFKQLEEMPKKLERIGATLRTHRIASR